MRVAVFALILVLLSAAAARSAESVQDHSRRQTFVIQCMLAEHRAEIGSGVVVARAGDVLTLATAAHLVRRGLPLQILDESRQDYYHVLGVSVVPGYDLALVQVRAQDAFPVEPVEFGTAAAGEPVWLWGNPGNQFWQFTTGSVLASDAQLPGAGIARHITIDCAACTYGDSGSGVFSQDGKLVGILSSGWQDKAGHLLFVQVEPVTPLEGALPAARAEPIAAK
ncbi:MAG TPA: serine protease [Candidatus Baltobacteraceae bacterium]|jgi:S1-C subfamily serine protease|nr:serine protease [Candidatus Baltobacteraceae bacterium]